MDFATYLDELCESFSNHRIYEIRDEKDLALFAIAASLYEISKTLEEMVNAPRDFLKESVELYNSGKTEK